MSQRLIMRNVMKIRKIVNVLIIALLLMAAAGCGRSTDSAQVSSDTGNTNEDKKDAVEIMADDRNATEEEAAAVLSFELPDKAYGSHVVLQGDTAYYCGADEVMSLDMTTGKSEIIWTSGGDYDREYAQMSGVGIALASKLYFYRDDSKTTGGITDVTRQLYAVDLSSKETGLVAEFSGDNYCTGSMFYTDGILYTDLDGVNDCFEIDSEGNVVKQLNRKELDEFALMPDGYTLPMFNGLGKIFPKDSMDSIGRMLLYNKENELVSYDPVSGRENVLGGYIRSRNDKQILIDTYNEGSITTGLINNKTGEYKFLTKMDDSLSVLGMDDDYMYYYNMDGSNNTDIGTMSLSDGKLNDIYHFEASESSLPVNSFSLSEATLTDGKLFIVESHDYALYPQAITLATGDTVTGDTPYYESLIGKVGSLVSATAAETDEETGQELINASAKLLHVSDKYAGAEQINAKMDERMDFFITNARERKGEALMAYQDELSFAAESDRDVYFIPYSYSEAVDDIDYLDDNYISFRIKGYDYLGGAHGMPYWISYIFDLNSGKQVTLKDLTDKSGGELKDIVTRAYVDKMNKEGRDLFWDDAEATVTEYVDLDTEAVYLTDEGLVFYMDPYLLASYAQGFQTVTIPYSALNINL